MEKRPNPVILCEQIYQYTKRQLAWRFFILIISNIPAKY
jgi:hypothetical protein